MATYTLQEIQNIWIPENTRVNRNNNLEASKVSYIPNNAVRIYDIVVDILNYLGIGPGGAVTDLSVTQTSNNVTILSSTGADGIIPSASSSLAGVMSSSDKIILDALNQLDGLPSGSTNLGTFSGTIIPDNTTIKNALQALETALQAIPSIVKGNLTSINNAITITNGNLSVFGSGTSVTFNPSNVLLSTLGGTLNLNQLNTTGAATGNVLTYNGTSWTFAPIPTTVHNNTTGLQGGLVTERYHITQAVYNKLTNINSSRLLGRNSTTNGEVEFITPTKSVIIAGTNVELVNDSTNPGTSKYYGTDALGIKGFHAVPSSSATFTTLDSANITLDFTSNVLTADLIETGVTPSTYGSSNQIPVLQIDEFGRIVSATLNSILIGSSSITDFNEAVDDRVAGLLVAGSGITITYNDVANTITITGTSSYTDENAQDAVGNILTDTFDIDFTYNDSLNSISAALTTTGVVANTYGNLAGTHYPRITVDNKGRITSAGEIQINITTTQITDFVEQVQDLMSTTLVAGANVSIVYNDVANTITISSTGGGGGGSTGGANGITYNAGNMSVELGGTLNQDTVIASNGGYGIEFLGMKRFTFTSQAVNAYSTIDSSETLSTPFRIAHSTTDNNLFAQLLLDCDGNGTGLFQHDIVTAGVSGVSLLPGQAYLQTTPISGTARRIGVNSNGVIAEGVDAKTTETNILWYNPISGEITHGTAPSAGNFEEYEVITGVRVMATGVGVTAAWSSGELTITIPTGVKLISAAVTLTDGSNVQSTADAGGMSNWIRVKFSGTTGYNTSMSNARIPTVQKAFFPSGTPSVSNPCSIDLDNNPAISVVGVASNSITIRVGNLIIPNGASFTFTGI